MCLSMFMMGMGGTLTLDAGVAAVLIRGRAKHEPAAHGGPELPRAARAIG